MMPRRDRRPLCGLVLFATFLVYGSLYPFSGWTMPPTALFGFVTDPFPVILDKGDVLQNALVYMPFGALAALSLRQRPQPARILPLTMLAGLCLSFGLESLQQFLPSRIASLPDVLLNAGGTAAGALLGMRLHRPGLSPAGATNHGEAPARQLVRLGMATIALWAIVHASPFVPSLDVGHLRRTGAALLQAWHAPASLDPARLAAHALSTAAIALLTSMLIRRRRFRLALPLALVGSVSGFALILVDRLPAVEAIAGASIAMAALPALVRLPPSSLAHAGLGFALLGLAVEASRPGAGTALHAFNWVPFAAQLDDPWALLSLPEAAWPFMAAVFFLHRTRWLPRRRTAVALAGGLCVLVLVFWLEWRQATLPGRFGDITQAVAALSGWVFAWVILQAAPRRRARPA